MVLRLPPIRVSLSYVLILEWLKPGDELTGKALHEHLNSIGMRSKYAPCNTIHDLRAAIVEAQQQLSERGIPVVHIETHGSEPAASLTVETVFGGSGHPSKWSDLGGVPHSAE